MIENTKLEIITPLDVLVSKETKMVVLPGLEGNLGIMKKHTPLITLLKRGVITLYNDNDKISEQIVVDGGIAEIKSDEIVVLSERAEVANVSNKQVLTEKLASSKKQMDNEDKEISTLAKDEVGFYKFVLDEIS